MSWREQAEAAINRAHNAIPDSATFEQRKAAIDAAYPFGLREYFPYRAWLKARKEYLAKFAAGGSRKVKPTALDVLPRDPATGRPVI